MFEAVEEVKVRASGGRGSTGAHTLNVSGFCLSLCELDRGNVAQRSMGASIVKTDELKAVAVGFRPRITTSGMTGGLPGTATRVLGHVGLGPRALCASSSAI